MGAQIGIGSSWSSPVIPKLQTISDDNPFNQLVTISQLSWMTSLVTLGACLGCCIFGCIAHTIGRRFAMCTLSLPMALGYILMLLFPKIEVYYVARCLTGLTIGGAQITTTTYTSEITSKENRGVLITLTSMMVGIGNIFCYSVGPWVKVNTFNLILATFPIISTILAILFCVETPYFYLLQNKIDLAKTSLIAYRDTNFKIDEEITKIAENIKEQQKGNLLEVIKTKIFLKCFIIATFLLIFQQFTGIDPIIMYSQSIFESTGSYMSSAICSIIFGAVQILSGAIAPLATMRFNRKTLLVASSLGVILSETILGTYCILKDSGSNVNSFNFVPISTLCFFMLSFNFAIGPLCWLVASEVYSTRVRPLAMASSIVIFNGVGFFITQYFNYVAEMIGIGPIFIIFAGLCLLCILFVHLYVIETKDKSLEEIQHILRH
ncbi:unnamed protein product [Psylliodes chrysocephalus]|nr:unnamed protein product [Psylliodes chrysocephala]